MPSWQDRPDARGPATLQLPGQGLFVSSGPLHEYDDANGFYLPLVYLLAVIINPIKPMAPTYTSESKKNTDSISSPGRETSPTVFPLRTLSYSTVSPLHPCVAP